MRIVRNTASTRWKEYSKAVKELLIFACNIPGEISERNVDVQYAVPSVAFVKVVSPIINGSNLSPTITFYLATEALTEHQGGQDFIFRLWTGRGTTINYPHPIVKELRYRVTLFAKNMEEVNTILSQVEVVAPKGYPFHLLINNQPTDIYVDSNFAMESNLMPGEAADRILQYGFDIVIPRAYINYVREVPADIIREIQLGVEADSPINSRFEEETGVSDYESIVTVFDVPDELSDLQSDEDHRTVTDQDITNWNTISQQVENLSYTHIQPTAATTWDIIHNMNKLPNITVLDNSNNQIMGEVDYISLNRVVVSFSVPVAGKAYLI